MSTQPLQIRKRPKSRTLVQGVPQVTTTPAAPPLRKATSMQSVKAGYRQQDGSTTQASTGRHSTLEAPGGLDRAFSPAPSTSASLRKHPFSRLFKRRQSRADILGAPNASEEDHSASPNLVKPQKLLGETNLQQDAQPGLRRVRSKRSFPALSALFRMGNSPKHEKHGSSPLPGPTFFEEEAVPRSPLPREMTKSPSMSMLYQAAQQDISDMMAESSYIPVPGTRRSLIVPTSPTPSRSRSNPDLFSHSRIGSMPPSPSPSRLLNNEATYPRHSTYSNKVHPNLPSSPLPSIRSPSSLRGAAMSISRAEIQRPISPVLRKPVPKLPADLVEPLQGSERGSVRVREATKSSLPYLESRSSTPSPAALPPSPTLPSPTTPVEQPVALPSRLLVKPINMRPTTAGTFGRPNTGASERPDTGASVQSKKPEMRIPGRLRRITDCEDLDEEEEVPDTPASKDTTISVDIAEYEGESIKLPTRDDSGYANLSDIASPEQAADTSRTDTPSTTGFPADFMQDEAAFDLRKSLESMEKQDNVSILSDLEKEWDHRLSTWREDCLEALGSTDGHAAEDLPVVPALPQHLQSRNASISSAEDLTRTGQLYESIMKQSMRSMDSGTSTTQTPRAGKKNGNARVRDIFIDKSLALSGLSNGSQQGRVSPSKRLYLRTDSPLKGMADAHATNPLSVSSQFDWISRPPTPLVTKQIPTRVSDEGDRQSTQHEDHYATSYFPPYETLLSRNIVPKTPPKLSPASNNPMLTPLFGPGQTRPEGGSSEISNIPRSSHSVLHDQQKVKADQGDSRMKALEEENKQLRRMLDILVRRNTAE